MKIITNAKNENMTELFSIARVTKTFPSLHTLLLSDVTSCPGAVMVYDIMGVFWVKRTIYSWVKRAHRLFSRELINRARDAFQNVMDEANFYPPPTSPRAQVAPGGTLYITLYACEILKKNFKKIFRKIGRGDCE